MTNQLFAGFVYSDGGTAVSGATVNLYDRNTITPVRATTTTDANGYWAISHATEGRFDVEIVNGTTTRRIKYDTSLQLTALEVQTLRVRNPGLTFDYDIVPGAITADRQLNLPVITGTDTLATLGLAQTFTNVITFSNATDASSTTVAAVVLSGGLGVAKKAYFGSAVFTVGGGDVTFGDGTAANNQSVITDGGSNSGKGPQWVLKRGGVQKWAVGTQSLQSGDNSDNLVFSNGGTNHVTITPGGGMQVGAPTGGDKGAGTINATAVYDDNTLLTDWLFDLHFNGRVSESDKHYRGQALYSMAETFQTAFDLHRLPWMPARDDFEGGRSLGAMTTRLWQGQEQQQVYLFDIDRRLSGLEAENVSLQQRIVALER